MCSQASKPNLFTACLYCQASRPASSCSKMANPSHSKPFFTVDETDLFVEQRSGWRLRGQGEGRQLAPGAIRAVYRRGLLRPPGVPLDPRDKIKAFECLNYPLLSPSHCLLPPRALLLSRSFSWCYCLEAPPLCGRTLSLKRAASLGLPCALKWPYKPKSAYKAKIAIQAIRITEGLTSLKALVACGAG